MRSMRFALTGLMAASFLMVTGCAPTSAPPWTGQPPATPDTPVDPPASTDNYSLVVSGTQTVTVNAGQQAVVQVYYANNGASVSNGAVTFAFQGSSNGSVLSTYTALTGSNGVAQTTLTAGQIAGSFQLQASAHGAMPATWNIQVTDGSGGGGDTPVDPTVNTKLSGTFELESTVEVTGSFEGSGLADGLNAIEEISDDPMDPAEYLVDKIVDEVAQGNVIVQTLAMVAKIALYEELGDMLDPEKDNILNKTKDLVQNISSIARKFKLSSTMYSTVAQDATQLMEVEHRLDAISWTLSGKTFKYTFEQLGQIAPEASAIKLTPTATPGRVTVDNHQFSFQFGAMVLAAVNALAIPLVDDKATNLEGFLNNLVDCEAIGAKINSGIGFGGDALYKTGCMIVMKTLASYVENQITGMDADEATLWVGGEMTLTDTTNDGFHNQISNGYWEGNFQLDSATTTLEAVNNKFSGNLKIGAGHE
jgi:hypothetical protein